MTIRRFMRSTIVYLSISFGISAMAVAVEQEPVERQLAIEPTTTELMQKRQEVLTQLVQIYVESYRRGEASISEVIHAQRELLSLQLELATIDADRLKLLEEAVELAKQLEDIALENYRAARASQADVLRSQDARLKAKIALLRELEISAKDRVGR